jgi:membrane AbrB-like protein
MVIKYIAIFIASCAGGLLFSLLHFPLPWTLGPLATVVVAKIGFKREVCWPTNMRNIGMVVLGYVMGSPFTPQTGYHILSQLPAMIIMTLLTVFLCMFGGYIVGKFLDLHLATSLLGSMPGGLSQMAMICEDVEGSDTAIVTLMQTVRVITTVFFVPFLVLHGLADHVERVSRPASNISIEQAPILALFAAVVVGAICFAKYIKLPSHFLIAPVVATAVLVLFGIDAPVLPPSVIAVVQVWVGIKMGMAVDFSSLANWRKLVILNFLSVFAVIVLFLGIDYVFARISGTSFITAYISTAPGGMNEMGLTALMVHADLSTVIAFMLFRLIFVLLVAIPLVRWWLYRKNKVCITYSNLD